MLEVSFYELVGEEDTRIGSIRWDGEKFTTFPSNDKFLSRILGESIGDPFKRMSYTSDKTPEEWMENLCKKYSSPYLRASKAKKV